jgi:molybdopterin converting factor subunit 1
VNVDVRYFAAAREATQLAHETLPIAAGATIAQLAEALVARHPALAGALPHLRFALDEAFVGLETPLTDGATVALIPPVGGG